MTDTTGNAIPAPLKTMRDITGTLEEPGSADNPVILAWADEIAARFPEMKLYCAQYTHDSIPWCGLTVGYVMAHNGIKPIYGPDDTDKFLWARAWSEFGTGVENPQPGDVLVFPGHVTMYDGEEGEYYLCRGGNQSDSVKVSRMYKGNVVAIRRAPGASVPVPIPPKPPKPTNTSPTFTNIIATEFGGSGDPNQSAYDGHTISDEELGVALPAKFVGPRPRVRVSKGEKSVDCAIVDVGPWNIHDEYWKTNSRPQAESGTDMYGRRTNKAGIDLTPAAAAILGINGKGTVDWMFIPPATKNVPKEEAVVRDASKKLKLLDTVRMWLKAAIAGATGIVSADNFGLFNSFTSLGNGAIPVKTLIALAVGGVGVWWLVNNIDKYSMEDFKAGRWTPSGIAEVNPAPVVPEVPPVPSPGVVEPETLPPPVQVEPPSATPN